MIKRVIFTVLVVFLSGCSSTSPLNVDNDVWLGTLTDAQNVAENGKLVFKQTGTELEVTLTIIRGTQQESRGLKGSLNDKKLAASFVNDTNDFSITLSGAFSDDGKSLGGTVRFVIDGATQDYTLQMSYDSELDAALLAPFAAKSGIRSVKGLLE